MLGVFVAGRYSALATFATGGAQSLGLQEEGFRISYRTSKDIINRTDGFGTSAVEGFNLGTDVHISGVGKEWLPGLIKLTNVYNGWTGGAAGVFALGTIGAADTDNAASIVSGLRPRAGHHFVTASRLICSS